MLEKDYGYIQTCEKDNGFIAPAAEKDFGFLTPDDGGSMI